MTKYYSQNDEERFVCEFFNGTTGRLLDVGAFDGIQMSNTRRLLETGWTGVLVEPAPHVFVKLMQNVEPFQDRVSLVQAAVSDTWKRTRLWIDLTPDREWSNTISKELVESGSVLKPAIPDVQVFTCTLSDLEKLGPYDFVSLDAEWEDMSILQRMPETMIRRLKLLCIEPREGQRQAMTDLLMSRHLKIVYSTPENLLAAQA